MGTICQGQTVLLKVLPWIYFFFTVKKWILLPGCSLRELFQCGFSPWITVLQDYTALAWIFHLLQITRKISSIWDSLCGLQIIRKVSPIWDSLCRLQLLTGACSSAGSPQPVSSFSIYPLSVAQGPLWAELWSYIPMGTSMSCKGTVCVSMVFTTDCRGISAPPHPFTWCPQSGFYDSFLTLLSQYLLRILPFLKYHSPNVATMLSRRLTCVLWWLCWSGCNLLFLSQDNPNLLPQKPSLYPSVPSIWTFPSNIHSKIWQPSCVCTENEGRNIISLFTQILYSRIQFEN